MIIVCVCVCVCVCECVRACVHAIQWCMYYFLTNVNTVINKRFFSGDCFFVSCKTIKYRKQQMQKETFL